jgi:hypothetical protein
MTAWKRDPKTAGEIRDQSKRVAARSALRMSRLKSAKPRFSSKSAPLT